MALVALALVVLVLVLAGTWTAWSGSRTTGAHGRLALGGERPARIVIEHGEWQVFDGEVRNDGTFDDSEVWMNTYLAPPSR